MLDGLELQLWQAYAIPYIVRPGVWCAVMAVWYLRTRDSLVCKKILRLMFSKRCRLVENRKLTCLKGSTVMIQLRVSGIRAPFSQWVIILVVLALLSFRD